MNAKSRLHRFRIDNNLCITCGKNRTHGVFCYKHWLSRAYSNMRNRCKGSKERDTPKWRCYKHVEVKMTRDEFISWGLMNRPMCIKPSIDRIDPKKHYSLDNICWLTSSENSAKANKQQDIKEGFYKCYMCKRIIPRTLEYFYKDSTRRGDKMRAECKSCTVRVAVINKRIRRQKKKNGSIKIHGRTKSRNST